MLNYTLHHFTFRVIVPYTVYKHMVIFMVIYILVATVMLVVGHLALYLSLINFLDISNLVMQNATMISLLVLSVSFPITILLVHWRENFITSNAYFFASAWLGIMWNFMIAMVAIWAAIGVSNTFGWHLNVTALSIVGLTIALIYSVYGFWNAQYPMVRNITVKIRNLPQAWHGRKAVHVSDIHLGAIHHIRFSRRVVNLINSANSDLVFITGDLYDGAGRELGLLAKPFNDLKASLGTYYIVGNHETYIGLDTVFKAIKESPLQTLQDKLVEIDGVQILGIDYPLPGKPHDMEPALKQLDSEKPSIVLQHEPRPSFINQIRSYGVDLILSGHTHRGQLWPFGGIAKGVYKKYDCGLYRDGDFTQFTTTGVGTWGPPMRTGNRPEIVCITFEKMS